MFELARCDLFDPLQGDADVEAQRGATSMWRLTGGRPLPDGRGAAGRLDFVLQVGNTR